MGSTLETAIAITLVLTILVFIITKPEDLCLSAVDYARDGIAEISFYVDESKITDFMAMDGYLVSSVSQERFCTYVSGISDSYKMIYSEVAGAVGGVSNEESEE